MLKTLYCLYIIVIILLALCAGLNLSFILSSVTHFFLEERNIISEFRILINTVGQIVWLFVIWHYASKPFVKTITSTILKIKKL